MYEQCREACSNSGYAWFGIEDRTGCMCQLAAPPTECISSGCVACTDDSSKKCGTAWRTSRYLVDPPASVGLSGGCYSSHGKPFY